MSLRPLCAPFLLVVAGYAAKIPDTLAQAESRLEQTSAQAPQARRIEFRMRGAQLLASRDPELSRKLVGLAVDEIRSGKNWDLGYAVLASFSATAPSQGIEILPNLLPSARVNMAAALARANRTDEALALYRQMLAEGELQLSTANVILAKLVKESPDEAGKLFQEIVTAAKLESIEPDEAFRLLDCAKTVAPVSRSSAAALCERIVQTASVAAYGANARTIITGTFQTAGGTVTTANSRDTLLVAGGNRLRELSPSRFADLKPLFRSWDLSSPITVKGLSIRSANAAPPKMEVSATAAIYQKMGRIRGLPADADRARLVLEIINDIRAVPSAPVRVSLVSSLANLSTEGDLGKAALSAVANTLAQSLTDAPADNCDPYLELARLIQFEQLPAPNSAPLLEVSAALLSVETAIRQEAGFALTGLDGKTYSLAALRGHVVLLNFWATWCPPCRREMPDMEKLYRNLQSKGLIVLAVSDEEREIVEAFQKKQNYTFPILLDPVRKVNASFNVEGIPKSFLFDRQGNLVAQAMDMRTESQFLEMLKLAGM